MKPITPEWRTLRRRSTASAFHALQVPALAEPEIWVHEITQPALVLGSTQRCDDIVDVEACEQAGIEVVRRRSGGGAVLLVPDEVVWVDVVLPAGHVGWSDDVHRPMVWLGRALSQAFSSAGVLGTQVHDGPMVDTDHSRLICFDGVGSGELLLDGKKLVGISQRRTRGAARLQCCWYIDHEPAALTSLLRAAPPADRLRAVATVPRDAATGVVDVLGDVLSEFSRP